MNNSDLISLEINRRMIELINQTFLDFEQKNGFKGVTVYTQDSFFCFTNKKVFIIEAINKQFELMMQWYNLFLLIESEWALFGKCTQTNQKSSSLTISLSIILMYYINIY